jgi:hypothetical protein
MLNFFSKHPGQAEYLMKKEFASTGCSVRPVTQCNEAYAKKAVRHWGQYPIGGA